jgi:hypothetical protein
MKVKIEVIDSTSKEAEVKDVKEESNSKVEVSKDDDE